MTDSPQIRFDPEANALYLRFSNKEIEETIELSESVYVDVDSDGLPVGLEVLDVSNGTLADLPQLTNSLALKDLMHPTAA